MEHYTTADKNYMSRALALAERGLGNVSPNPMVGCIIVAEGNVIGEGWHRVYGGPHAEVNAIQSVNDDRLLEKSTVYVTLEPCSHFGKTPPCADLLIEKKVKKVVIATEDPNPKVAGKGAEKLINAGIEVSTGLYKGKAQNINRRFFTSFNKQRPFIILKWAQTLDGFIARKDYSSKWISNAYSRQLVHKWRSEEDAILVGRNTAHYDNPSLNVRDYVGEDPLRVVIDRNLKLSNKLRIFTDGLSTIIYNLKKEDVSGELRYVKLAEISFFQDLFFDLYQRGIQSIIVEGGAAILSHLIKENLWNEARIFTGSTNFDEGINAPVIKGNLLSHEFVGTDELKIINNPDG